MINGLVSFNSEHDAMDQLTSSQQALPSIPPSQGLYALLLMRMEDGVRSLSARSFKVHHGTHEWLGKEEDVYLEAEKVSHLLKEVCKNRLA